MSRTILIGIDGMDPTVTEQLMGAGQLPNFERLASRGCYNRLPTITPPQSPVVWSSIATGLSPAEHGIYDFIHRDPATYRPFLSLHQMEQGRYVNPVRGETFWEKAARQGIPSTVIKWPMAFPPRPFPGKILAGLGVPDIRGMLGTYTYFTSAPDRIETDAKGRIVPISSRGGQIQTDITGPFTAGLTGRKASSVPLSISVDGNSAQCRIGRQAFTLLPGQWSPWISISFDAGFFRTIQGSVRFLLASIQPDFALYMTPVNVPYQSSEFPISHPADYATELAKPAGGFATLGMAEDTNAVNDGALDEDAFITLCHSIMAEREAMFRYELDRFKDGILACVFDTTDRIQHIFWRMHDKTHPAHDASLARRYEDVIPNYYRWMDHILGTVLKQAADATVICCSDHGFGSFRRSVHVNNWLVASGYMKLKTGASGCDGLFESVDWAETRAYAVGFTGIYLNLRGREKEGTVPPEKAAGLKRELMERLEQLTDEGARVMQQAHDASELYGNAAGSGGPDIIAGFAAGYRASWQTAVGGVVEGCLIEDNLKKWSGDHCCDASLVPGVLFSSNGEAGRARGTQDISRLIEESLHA